MQPMGTRRLVIAGIKEMRVVNFMRVPVLGRVALDILSGWNVVSIELLVLEIQFPKSVHVHGVKVCYLVTQWIMQAP